MHIYYENEQKAYDESATNISLSKEQLRSKVNNMAATIRNGKQREKRSKEKCKKLEDIFSNMDMNLDDMDDVERGDNAKDMEAILNMADIDSHLKKVASSYIASSNVFETEDVTTKIQEFADGFKEKMNILVKQLKGKGT